MEKTATYQFIPEYTREEIYAALTDREIYEAYLDQEITLTKKVVCCFHNDKTPSMGFYYRGQNLRYRCFSCGASGGSIDFVMALLHLPYSIALRMIAKKCGLTQERVEVEVRKIDMHQITHRKTDTVLIPILKPFNAVDHDYWSRFHIPLEMLLAYGVSACSRVYLVKDGVYKLTCEYELANPVYCYRINDRYKIYRPLGDKKYKWLNTTTSLDMQGLQQLPSPAASNLLIITKSLKDVMVLRVLGYDAVAPESEGAFIPEKIMDYLHSQYADIVLFYDNDEPGIKYSKVTSKRLNLPYILVDGDKGAKDISDLVEMEGLEEGQLKMKRILERRLFDTTTTS